MVTIGLGGRGVNDTVAIDCTTLVKLYAIPSGKRKWGMIVTVYADGGNNNTYFLKYNNTSVNKTDNGNWVLASTVIGGGGGGGGYQGYYNAASGNFPNSGVGVTAGQFWIIDPSTAGGVIQGIDVPPGATVMAGITNPANLPANWIINQ